MSSDRKKKAVRCADCRAGEHPDFDDDVRLVLIRDPDVPRYRKRAYLCSEHRQAYEWDGYTVTLIERK